MHRSDRVSKIIEKELGKIIFEDVKDDRLRFVNITTVKLTKDLSYATVYYRVIGTEDQIKATSQNLLDAKGFIKMKLSKALTIRKVPELIFKYDESIDYGNKIEAIIKEIKSK
ncbi:MAG: 30S ribosome-binding factor RbfA [Bacilli bacterium]|nr:30S ribosome-binding factor RbfA [Bacilli bacterium]